MLLLLAWARMICRPRRSCPRFWELLQGDSLLVLIDKMIRPEEVEFVLRLHGLWEGLLAIPPPPDPPFDVECMEPILTIEEWCWWRPEDSDPAQFHLTVPHWSPDFESQEWQPTGDSPETSRAWQAQEITLDEDRILVLDADPPAQEEFPEFFYD
jgi:hypothetical protein